MRSTQSQSSDALSLKLSQLEAERKGLKARVEQLEADMYKAGRERAEAVGARDRALEEARGLKRGKEEAEGKLAEASREAERARREAEELRARMGQLEKEAAGFEEQRCLFQQNMEGLAKLNK
jgi:chromosome segregation ATPase